MYRRFSHKSLHLLWRISESPCFTHEKIRKNPIKNNIKQPWRQDAYVLPAIRQPTVAQPRRAAFRSQALAFKHLDVEVTAVKVAFFREALIEAAESRDGCFGIKKREGCPDII